MLWGSAALFALSACPQDDQGEAPTRSTQDPGSGEATDPEAEADPRAEADPWAEAGPEPEADRDAGAEDDLAEPTGAGGRGASLPQEALAVLERTRDAAAERDWVRLEAEMAEEFTTRVDPKREPRARALEAWREEPADLDNLAELIAERERACELHERAHDDKTYVECMLPENPFRIVFTKQDDGTYRFTHMMPAGV